MGLTTAFFLNRGGHEVTLVDRQNGAGLETSFANGGLVTPSMPEPWNGPGCVRVLLSSLLRSDAALQLRFRALPGLVGWGLRFLANSRVARFQDNSLKNLRLAQHSLKTLQALREAAQLSYGQAALGTLRIFRESASLERATAGAQALAKEDIAFRRLSAAQTTALEPALAPIEQELVGALHYGGDEAGDAHRFCVGLAEYLRRQGVDFRFGTEVSGLEARSHRIVAAASDRGPLVADRYVVACGSYSTLLLRRIGIHLPVQPAKGYSITITGEQKPQPLRIPVVDDELHAAVVPLDGVIRVAGTAEFAGYDRTMSPVRIANLLRLVRKVLPRMEFDPARVKAWCGLRPMSTDGVPIIGRTPFSNLFLNTGHGHLGWTLSVGSGQLLADVLSNNSPALDPAPYALGRFRGEQN